MSRNNGRNKQLAAVLRENDDAPCIFCNQTTDDEIIFGKMYTLRDITCHYFCVLLSSCAIQQGKDDEGLFGFLYNDIVEEAKRGKRNKCSYCSRIGATLGCSNRLCRKQFHLPCARESDALSLFFGTYQTFCERHSPKQQLPDVLLVKANARIPPEIRKRLSKSTKMRKQKKLPKSTNTKRANESVVTVNSDGECICVICYEPVSGYPSPQSFWPPCCARDAWFHRLCLQRMVLSAGMHFLKCPLCNDKQIFLQAIMDHGFYVPDRDAAWELESNAFADLYETPIECTAEFCKCYMGRAHESAGPWDLKLCMLCGSSAIHKACAHTNDKNYICQLCGNVPVQNLDSLADDRQSESVVPSTSSGGTSTNVPVVITRMSFRGNDRSRLPSNTSSTSPLVSLQDEIRNEPQSLRFKNESKVHRELFVLFKLLDENLQRSIVALDSTDREFLVKSLKVKLKKPLPLSVKQKIVKSVIKEIAIESEKKKEQRIVHNLLPYEIEDNEQQELCEDINEPIKDIIEIDETNYVQWTNITDITEDSKVASEVHTENDTNYEPKSIDFAVDDTVGNNENCQGEGSGTGPRVRSQLRKRHFSMDSEDVPLKFMKNITREGNGTGEPKVKRGRNTKKTMKRKEGEHRERKGGKHTRRQKAPKASKASKRSSRVPKINLNNKSNTKENENSDNRTSNVDNDRNSERRKEKDGSEDSEQFYCEDTYTREDINFYRLRCILERNFVNIKRTTRKRVVRRMKKHRSNVLNRHVLNLPTQNTSSDRSHDLPEPKAAETRKSSPVNSKLKQTKIDHYFEKT